jgi:anaerobic selenocysteine-containing dehydrogenase
MHNDEALTAGRRATNRVHMHPDDAHAAGIEAGSLVEVSSDVGSVVLPATLTTDMMRGAIALPHGWGHQAATGLTVARMKGGANANLLSADGPDRLERFSGMAQLNGILVSMKPAVET